jgi:hypothetical protein
MKKFGAVVVVVAVINRFRYPYSAFHVNIHVGGVVEHRRFGEQVYFQVVGQVEVQVL